MWFGLLSCFVCRIPCRVFCSDGLVIIYCFSFCLLWKIFIAPSIFWVEYLIVIAFLGRVSYSWNYFHSVPIIPYTMPFWFLNFCWELCCDFDGFIFICYLFFLFTAFNILSLLSLLVVVMTICHGKALFLSSLFGVLEASSTWMGKTLLRFGNFSVITLLNTYESLLFALFLLLQCPWFSGLIFWLSCWVLTYSFYSSSIVWLIFLQLFL
jgi:hypothetical protein